MALLVAFAATTLLHASEMAPTRSGDTRSIMQEGKAFPAEGYLRLGGIRLKKGADCAIPDGAIACRLLPK